MKKEFKRQIKQDEFRSGVEETLDWIKEHRDEVRVTVLVVVVVGSLVLGLRYYQDHRTSEAARSFTEALAAYDAPLKGEIPAGADQPTGPVFSTAQEKYQKAAEEFGKLADRYPSLPAGVRASYYRALCQMHLGHLDEARKDLTSLASHQEADVPLVPALARMALAEVDRESGHVDQAVEAYRQMVADPDLPLPRDHALMKLASTLEDAHRFKEAEASYRRLVEEFPTSVYAQEARTRAQYLGGPAQG